MGAWLTDAVFVALVLVVSSQFSHGTVGQSTRNHILIALALVLPYAALRIYLVRLWRRRKQAERQHGAVIERRPR